MSPISTTTKPARARSGNVFAQALLLRRARTEVVMIIEAGLSNRHNLCMPRMCDELLERKIELLVRVVGMRAKRAVDLRKTLGDREHLGMSSQQRADGHDVGHPGRTRTRHDAIKVPAKIGKVEMAVAIDQRKLRSLTFVIIRCRHRKSLFFN